MAKIDSIFKKEIKRVEPHKRMIIKWIHYTKLVDNKDQYCNERDQQEIETLADLIEADGEVLQPLIVRRIDTDEYEIVAGHKRRRACRLLTEERGKEQFSFVPCYVMAGSEAQAKFRLYSSNGFHEKTDDEKLHELEQMKFLLETYPEEFPQVSGGRMVERLAKLLNMKKTTVGDYLTISKNLSEKGREHLRKGKLKKSAALELSSLPKKKQDELLDQGVVTHKEIKEIKKAEQKPPLKDMHIAIREENTGSDSISEKEGILADAVQEEMKGQYCDSKLDLVLVQEMLREAEGRLEEMKKNCNKYEKGFRKQELMIQAYTDLIKKIGPTYNGSQPALPV